jgi:hypothetical protein
MRFDQANVKKDLTLNTVNPIKNPNPGFKTGDPQKKKGIFYGVPINL